MTSSPTVPSRGSATRTSTPSSYRRETESPSICARPPTPALSGRRRRGAPARPRLELLGAVGVLERSMGISWVPGGKRFEVRAHPPVGDRRRESRGARPQLEELALSASNSASLNYRRVVAVVQPLVAPVSARSSSARRRGLRWGSWDQELTRSIECRRSTSGHKCFAARLVADPSEDRRWMAARSRRIPPIRVAPVGRGPFGENPPRTFDRFGRGPQRGSPRARPTQHLLYLVTQLTVSPVIGMRDRPPPIRSAGLEPAVREVGGFELPLRLASFPS